MTTTLQLLRNPKFRLGAKLKQWVIPITGQSSGTPTAGTLVFSATEDMTLTATGDVSISVVRAADSIYRLHTVTINCPNGGSGTIRVPDRSKIVAMGNHNGASNPTVQFYTGTNTTSPILSWNLNDLGANVQKIRQASEYTIILPAIGTMQWDQKKLYVAVSGNNLDITLTGAVSQNLEALSIVGNNIYMSYSGALPPNIRIIYLDGSNIDWTGLDFSGTSNMLGLLMLNFRISKMSSPDMVTLLTSLTNRVGGLPATITINDYADFAAPPQSVIDAVAALKLAKPNVTTVNLGA